MTEKTAPSLLKIATRAHISLHRTRKAIAASQPNPVEWQDLAGLCESQLRQVCSFRRSGLRLLKATLDDVSLRQCDGEDGGCAGLPCVAFSSNGIFSASKSFLELSGRPFERLLGQDLSKAPLHRMPQEVGNAKVNKEAWKELEMLHNKLVTGKVTQRGRASVKIIRTRKALVAFDVAGDAKAAAPGPGNPPLRLKDREKYGDEDVCPVTLSLLVSPDIEGKPFWNLLHAFQTSFRGETCVVHVFMPVNAPVVPLVWQTDPCDSSLSGPAPELAAFLPKILVHLRCGLAKLQREDARHVCRLEEDAGVEYDKFKQDDSGSEEEAEGAPGMSPSTSGPDHHKDVSFEELWEGKAPLGCRPQAWEVAEQRCRHLHYATNDCAYAGCHFVPRFGTVAAIPYAQLTRWEEIFAEGGKECIARWKTGNPSYKPELSDNVPFALLDPYEVDTPLVYMSRGFESLTGHWRSWAIGRNIRFITLHDQALNRAFNGQELVRMDEFCNNNDTQDLPKAQEGEQTTKKPPEAALCLLQLRDAKTTVPFWSIVHLRHVWIRDPGDSDDDLDFAMKHFVFCVMMPLQKQKAALSDLLPSVPTEKSIQMVSRLRQLLFEKSQTVELTERNVEALADEVIPEWLLECGRHKDTCMVGEHFVPRVGFASVHEFAGCWQNFLRSAERLVRKIIGEEIRGKAAEDDKFQDMLDRAVRDEEGGLVCWVSDPKSKELPIVFFSRAAQDVMGYSSDFVLARSPILLQPKKQRIDAAINNEEFLRIKDFCIHSRQPGDSMTSLMLFERKNGSRIPALLMVTIHQAPECRQQYALSVIIPVETKLPAVLHSHQVSELQEDNLNLAIDEWGGFFTQIREEMLTSRGGYGFEAATRLTSRFQAHLQNSEDYEGDIFVPRIGVIEVQRFQQSGVLKHVLSTIRQDARRVFDMPDWTGEEQRRTPGMELTTPGQPHIIVTIADPTGQDCPLVWLSQGFEELTGYTHEWALGRNCRFLQPKSRDRNQQFNGDQLDKLRSFCAAGRNGMPALTRTFALLVNETRNGAPFWNFSCYQHVEVLGRQYIVCMSTQIKQYNVKLAELLCLDQEALKQLARLKALLQRHEGGAKFTSLKVVLEQLFFAFWSDFPRVLQAPSFKANANAIINQELSIFGLESSVNNFQAITDGMQSGIRHLHIALPSGPSTKEAEAIAFVRKILPLKLAEAMNYLNSLRLDYLRESMVFTVRTPPHMLTVLPEVRKTLLTAGYSVLCWLLDVRSCSITETAELWQALTQLKSPGETLGLYGGGEMGARLLAAAQGVSRGAKVAMYAADMHPGRRPDEPEVRLMGSLRSMGIIPMACNVFGPKESWIHSPDAMAAAARVGQPPTMLALKWAEQKGFLCIIPRMIQHSQETEPPDSMHRSFVRAYCAAPPAEACVAALNMSAIGFTSAQAAQAASVTPVNKPDVKRQSTPTSARHKMQAIQPAKATMSTCATGVQKIAERKVEDDGKGKVRYQALPDVLARAKSPRLGTGVIWHGETSYAAVPSSALPPGKQARPPSSLLRKAPFEHDDGMMSYELPRRPRTMEDFQHELIRVSDKREARTTTPSSRQGSKRAGPRRLHGAAVQTTLEGAVPPPKVVSPRSHPASVTGSAPPSPLQSARATPMPVIDSLWPRSPRTTRELSGKSAWQPAAQIEEWPPQGQAARRRKWSGEEGCIARKS